MKFRKFIKGFVEQFSFVKRNSNVNKNKKKIYSEGIIRGVLFVNKILLTNKTQVKIPLFSSFFISDSRGFMSITNILWALISTVVLFTLMPIMLPYMNNATAELEASGYWEAATLVKLLPFAMVVIFIRGLVKAGEPIIYSARDFIRRGRGGDDEDFW